MATHQLVQVAAGGLVIDGIRRLVRRRSSIRQRSQGAVEAGLGLVVLSREPIAVPDLYRVFAYVYDPISEASRHWQNQDVYQHFDNALASYLPTGGRVLDLGCGTGANLQRLTALGRPLRICQRTSSRNEDWVE